MTTKMPSSVVPIDVSGQTFSRMASFRRSLIHVDFFIRRKKKDKRRNSVAEGDTKDLKNVLQNFINEEHSIIKNGTLSKKLNSNGNFKPAVEDKNVPNQETNNNFHKDIADIKDCSENVALQKNYYAEQDKMQTLQNGKVKVEQKNNHSDGMKSFINKRKPKSNLPISTLSAAMNVAVEMRQLNVKEDQSSCSNWSYSSDHNSSDSDLKEKEQDHSVAINGEDSGFSDNFRNRSKGNCKVPNSKATAENENNETFSSASSEKNSMQDDQSSNATSMESDAFLMSSDESDEDSSKVFIQKYGSSTSLSTMSDGSLNSLLSQTGTEMASSTGTLTSIGQERFPTPPPPPPPFVIVALKKEVISDTIPVISKTNANSKNPSLKASLKYETSFESSKIISPKKSTKSNKRKSSTDSNKSIFTSLVSKKSQSKEQCKGKNLHTKSTMTQPHFDMYGSSSPQKISRTSLFVKENKQPLSGMDSKSYLQSFASSIKNKSVDNNVHKEVILSEVSTASNTLSDIVSQKNNPEIPLKYAHHVIVTPISRQDENNKYLCRKSLFSDNVIKPDLENENTSKSLYYKSKGAENTTYSLQKSQLQRPKTLLTGPKTAARVVLDPEGRVIYSTNSLDRNLPNGFPHQHLPTRKNTEKYMLSPLPINMPENTNHYLPPPTCSTPQRSYFQKKGNDNSCCDKNTEKIYNFTTFVDAYIERNENSKVSEIPLSNSNPNNFHGNTSEIENHVYMDQSKNKNPNTSKLTLPSYSEAVGRHCPHIVLADPNISGLPSVNTILTEENINLHLENIERLNKMHLESIANSYKSLISPQNNRSSPLDSNLSQLQKSTMSTEDLFAVIHDCKKRMNIKTDSDISLGSSSRSSSPSFLRSNQTKGILAETGFLSPRNSSNFNDCRDRRSWADFRPASSSPNERKSLASDRLGRTKPTSMHDFKMLLLQARSNTQISGPKKSAVEMLKISSLSKSPNAEVPSERTHYLQSLSVQSSPTSPSYIHNGHSTVPFKRHNNRVRSSLHSRYTMYPPIFEDCSEEVEIKS